MPRRDGASRPEGAIPRMCGITGWISYARDLTAEREVLEAMHRTMSCRGPDAEGVWVDRHAALGHRRLMSRDLLAEIDLEGYRDARYRQALAEVPHLEGESATERRMREICHMHLTRFVQVLLDRKDRISMAVGLEVRVPFCDHRLVEYVFNTPWSLKTFDGREKSLLRAATRDVLPDVVADRVKSPYPSTQDTRYADALRGQVRDLLADPDAPARPLVDEEAAGRAVRSTGHESRQAMEMTLGVDSWLRRYGVELAL